ncbi:MAG: hypothetical protein Q8W45_11930 [Candidatus Palauibacterales bacterium]|nr:hypothetical protein [Candidatus Palauibacterales bacterium]
MSTSRWTLTHPYGGDPMVALVAARAAIAGDVCPATEGATGGFSARPIRLEDRLTGLRKNDDNTMTQVDGEDPGP